MAAMMQMDRIFSPPSFRIRFMKFLLVFALALATFEAATAEVVFGNLNTSSSASVGSGFTWFAQRFTTVSSGTGFGVDLNLLTQSGPQSYAVELWSADVAGTNVSALLAAIGSGTVSSADKTAVTSFTSSYSLDAATDYFIKIVASSGIFAIALGPNSSASLNSIVRYGVGNLNNNTTSVALGMEVEVAAVPEPGAITLAGIAAGIVALRAVHHRKRQQPRGCHGFWRRRRNRVFDLFSSQR
jgi:hypothetical protein